MHLEVYIERMKREYDVEVESRLKIIEAKIAEIEVKLYELKSAPAPAPAAAPAVVEGDINVEALAKILRMVEPNFDKLYKQFSS